MTNTRSITILDKLQKTYWPKPNGRSVVVNVVYLVLIVGVV